MVNINQSLVTIICICYNHEDYIKESLESAYLQSHKNTEIIIIDDNSSDNSVAKIEDWISSKPEIIKFIANKKNIGNTKSFNNAFKHSKGEYIIDLATDDILDKDCVKNHLMNFSKKEKLNAGVSYCNVELIDTNGSYIDYHWDVDSSKKTIHPPKDGDIYSELLTKYYLNPTGIFVKKDVFTKLNGYDDTLVYEDFDFWIRSAIKYNYIYGDFIGVKKRIVPSSHSSTSSINSKKRRLFNKSTYIVCKKAFKQNKTKLHKKALNQRIIHEWKIVVKRMNIQLSINYFILFFKNLLLK